MATYITDRVIPDGSIGFNELDKNSGSFMFRNKIINGAMMIDQRKEGLVHTIASNALYTIDRVAVGAGTGTAVTAQRVTDAPAGFSRSLRCTVTGAKAPVSFESSYVHFTLEGQNLVDLAYGTASAKTITISFWVKSSIAGTFSGHWRTLTGSYSTGTWRSYVFTYSINQANTWEYKTITVPGDTAASFNLDNTFGAGLMFDLGCGPTGLTSNINQWQTGNFHGASSAIKLIQTNGATFQVTGVQVELGSAATPFEWRPAGVELDLCQRYFQEINAADNQPWLVRASDNHNEYYASFYLPVALRAEPVITNTIVSPDNRIHKPYIRWDTYSSNSWGWNPKVPNRINAAVVPSNNDPGSRALSLYGDRWFATAEL